MNTTNQQVLQELYNKARDANKLSVMFKIIELALQYSITLSACTAGTKQPLVEEPPADKDYVEDDEYPQGDIADLIQFILSKAS